MMQRVLPLLWLAPALVQNGDRPGEEQPPLPEGLEVPAAPVRTPEEEAATFRLAPGFRVELVAAEPLVRDPVAMAFDGDGRLWVVEMRGYMPNVDGEGEREPIGCIAVLEDEDGDGRMDRRSEFLSGLVLPRAVAPARGGALVIAPPELLFCRDTDGDGRADVREVVDTGLEGLANPEHAINGLLYTHHNSFRCANAGVEYRWERDGWQRIANSGGGQWGITKDDDGRVFYNTNSDPLRGDLFPSLYAARNPAHGRATGINVGMTPEREVFPARITPGVNRGYQPATLREDFTLHRFTAACAPLVHRGGLPAEYRGNAFVAEPAANLLKRYVLGEHDGWTLHARQAWQGRELWTSTDERFRPVALCDGPDGAVYVADLYRGIIQHRIFMTSFLRTQVLERGLDAPIGLGRIWRLVHEDSRRFERPRMSECSWSELAGYLSHPSGWWRDTAQRILVEEGRGVRDAREVVREHLTETESALGRVHALWALAGMDDVDRELVERALADTDPRVVRTGVRIAEPLLSTGEPTLAARLVAVARAGDKRCRHQVLLSLGEGRSGATDAALAELAAELAEGVDLRSAIFSGLHQRELLFLDRAFALGSWREASPGREAMLRLVARSLVNERSAHGIEALLERARAQAARLPWRALALLGGALDARGKGPKGEPGHVRVARRPPALDGLLALEDEALRARAIELEGALLWPGKPGIDPELELRPLSAAELASFERGRATYTAVCAACHQGSGRGEPGKAPPLRGAAAVLGDPRPLAATLIHGMRGPIERDGVDWDLEMPAFAASDEELADVMTYLRREWGHGAEPVAPELVGEVRAATAERRGAWSEAELAAAFGE